MYVRLVDFLKGEGITTVMTNLTGADGAMEATEVGISSLVDTWILLRDIELGGERNRGIYVLKARGTAHSNQIREFLLTSQGVQLKDVYVGPQGVLTGSMRLAQENRERSAQQAERQEAEARLRSFERKRRTLEAQIASMRAELEEEQAAILRLGAEQAERDQRGRQERQQRQPLRARVRRVSHRCLRRRRPLRRRCGFHANAAGAAVRCP